MLFFNLMTSQEQPIDTLQVNDLEEIVISAQFTPRSEKNSIYKVNIINKKTIESKTATNLTELLRQELDIDFSNNAVFCAGVELQGVSKVYFK